MRRLLLPLLLAANVVQAASEYPPSYQWRTFTTEHFHVHFHQGEEELARRAGTIAEDVHTKLSPVLRWTPSGRTHLILTDHVDVSNGSATPFPSNRIEIYISAPGGDPSSPIAYYDDWLDLVITHEYAHILHLDQARAIPAVLRRILGRHPIAFPNDFSPLWMIEGIATWAESELTDAGRVKGTFVDMVLRAAAVEGRWPTEAQSSGLTPYWPGGSARYFFGSKFLDWLARRHGRDAVALYFKKYSERLLFNVNSSAREAFGKTIPELWTEWSQEQQAAYRAELERMRAGGLTTPRRLTNLGYETKYPVLSPDGTRIAYVHRGPFERPTIRVWDLAAGRDVATHQVHTTSPLSWSADGTTIAYSDLEFVGSFAILSDLYLWRAGDRRERRLTRGARLKDPAFTPDGRALIAVENRYGRNRLVEVDAATGAMRTLVEPDDSTQFSEPAVSGDRIAVAEWKEGRIDVVTYSRTGARIANLTAAFPRSTNAAPRFTSDGAQLVFTSDVDGTANIFAVSADGDGAPRRLTNVFGGAFFPTTRDGRTIWFADCHANGFDLARVDVSTEFATTPRALPPAREKAATEAAALTAPSQPYSPRRAGLLPRWWSPVISESGFGATTSGGDVLGRHQYTATITNEYQSVVYLYDRFYPTFTLAGLRYEDDVIGFRIGPDVVPFTSTNERVVAQMTLPFRRFDRQFYTWLGGVRDRVTGNPPAGVAESDLDRNGVFRGTLQGFKAGVLFNNTVRHGFSISPENGVTARLDYENLGGDATLRQLRADLRGYLAIPYRRSPLGRHVLAARVAGGRQTGDFILQKELRVGGIGEGEFLGVESRNFPVRGYDGSTLRGNRAALASLEYRVPLVEIDRGPSTWPLFFHRVVGDVFVDAGRAWQRSGGQRTIASAGAEVALDTFLSYFLPVRFRAGAAYRLRDPGKGEVEPFFALESAF